ncbi:MAG: hypothetical protein COC17_05580 [Hyphomicrobiales bacterium]|nr:MAG: hypothetical protein COC17_05580 [Hyphomicrobiales bacterium]
MVQQGYPILTLVQLVTKVFTIAKTSVKTRKLLRMLKALKTWLLNIFVKPLKRLITKALPIHISITTAGRKVLFTHFLK